MEGNLATKDNLETAFAGESRAYMKYLAFALAAEKEGQRQVAKLFRALAESEMVHAQSHLSTMGEVGQTEDNISSAIDGETYEFTQMYPAFINQAEKEGNQRAAMSFRNAMAAEKVHAGLLSSFLDRTGREGEYHVCSNCGHVAAGNAPDKCPACGATGQKFKQIT
jgi:rubrerythrin